MLATTGKNAKIKVLIPFYCICLIYLLSVQNIIYLII